MGSRCTAHRRCCELDVMFETGGRFENDSENSGRMKLPSPEMVKEAEKEFDKRGEKRIILFTYKFAAKIRYLWGCREGCWIYLLELRAEEI